MKSLASMIRCITSKQVCFPLIFTIATVSLVISLTEFSKIRTPTWHGKRTIRLAVRQHSNRNGVKLWEEWVPEQEETRNDNFVVPVINRPLLRNSAAMKVKLLKRRSVKVMEKEPDEDVDSTAKAGHVNSFVNITDASDQRERPSDFDESALYNSSYLETFNDTLDDATMFFSDGETTEATEKHTKGKIEPLPEQTRGVIILTNYRSGSTFLGELFNQHSQAFYTFEPLYPFGSNCSFEIPRRVSILQDMMKCTFPDMQTLYQDINRDSEFGHVHGSCLRNNFCFRYNHKDLCSEDLCPNGNRKTCLSCGPVELDRVNNKCRSKKVSAIKVIKLCDIMDLEPLIHDPSVDFKIIHLVRDPRGIASSRWKIHPNWDIAENIVQTCQRQMLNVRAGRNVAWLKSRYKLVKYEDMATNPIALPADIYRFVGLPFEAEMKAWISRNTQLRQENGNNSSEEEEATLDKRKSGYDARKDPYSTQRDSNAAMQAWRNHIPFTTVDKIQKRCFGTMRSLGYKDFRNKYDLLNLNISAFV